MNPKHNLNPAEPEINEVEKDKTLQEMERAVALIFNKILEEGNRIKGFMGIIEDVQALLESIIQGDIETAEKYVVKFTGLGGKDLFVEVGKITRKLHDSIKEFQDTIRPRLQDMPINELPQANDKLNWVIQKTEEAASRTISLVEKHLLYLDKSSSLIRCLEGWKRENRIPSELDRGSLDQLLLMNKELSKDLMEIMLAQDFQDLTGQIIKKVMALIAEIESHLVQILRIFGLKMESVARPEKGERPRRPVMETVVSSQSDVDDILKQFGF
ncbi:MAG: protein phosphatase CheZ [Thermodesulfobacteriota bacterium]